MNIELTPDKTVDLHVRQRDVDPSENNPLRLNSESFPPLLGGVYVIRFKQKCIRRLRGESPILRIGHAKDYSDRFRQYGSPDVCADLNVPLSDVLNGNGKAQKIVIFTLYELLAKHEHSDAIVVDLYYNASERKFLYQFVNDHWETPPLNFSMHAQP